MLVKREKSKNKTSKVSSMRRRQNMCYLGIKRRHYHNNSSPVTCMRFLGRWEIEWCLCKDSSVFEAYRHSGQKCNLIATCIPLDRIRVPLDRTSIPLDRTSIPLDRTFLPLDRTSIPLDGTFLPLDRTFIPLDRTFLPFDRTSIILWLTLLHWFIPLWHFIFIRTSVETAFHRIVTIVRP